MTDQERGKQMVDVELGNHVMSLGRECRIKAFWNGESMKNADILVEDIATEDEWWAAPDTLRPVEADEA